MENPSSPLDTLRQLKEMLDAGALTPTEFEALKQRLVFAPAAPGPVAAEPAAPAATALPAPEVPSVATAPTTPSFSSGPSLSDIPPTPPEGEVDALVFEPVPEPAFMPGASADSPVAVGGPGYGEAAMLPDDDAPDLTPAPAQGNSSLGLVLAIGAVLVFLAVVAYLGFTRPASEHISSTSQTAADSVATAIETGPQVAPLPAITTAPETVRVAPTNPAPIIQPRPAAPVADSAAPVISPTVVDTTRRR